MINALTHNLLMDTVQYMDYLSDARQRSVREFYEYTRRLEEQRQKYKRLKADLTDDFQPRYQSITTTIPTMELAGE